MNAQTIDDTATSDYYAGASLGLIFAPNVTGSIAGQFGIRDVLAENLDARFDLGVLFSGGFNVGANALLQLRPRGRYPHHDLRRWRPPSVHCEPHSLRFKLPWRRELPI